MPIAVFAGCCANGAPKPVLPNGLWDRSCANPTRLFTNQKSGTGGLTRWNSSRGVARADANRISHSWKWNVDSESERLHLLNEFALAIPKRIVFLAGRHPPMKSRLSVNQPAFGCTRISCSVMRNRATRGHGPDSRVGAFLDIHSPNQPNCHRISCDV
jgi:hypothetical protein